LTGDSGDSEAGRPEAGTPEAGTAQSADGAVTRRVTVLNKAGLHARPAMIISMEAKKHAADIELVLQSVPADHHLEPGTPVDAKNSIELISLGAPQGTELDVVGRGDGAEAAVGAIVLLFETHFGLEPE